MILFHSSVDRQLRVLACRRTAGASKRLVLDDPELVAVIESKLFVSIDVSNSEESDSRKFEILVIDEHFDGDEIRITRMIDEAGNITVASSIDAISLSVLLIVIKY